MEFTIGIEKEVIDVLGEAEATFEFRPVEGNAPHNHVTFYKLSAVHAEFAMGGVLLTLVEREGLEVYFGVYTVVETSFVLEYFLDNPRSGAATYDENNVLAC